MLVAENPEGLEGASRPQLPSLKHSHRSSITTRPDITLSRPSSTRNKHEKQQYLLVCCTHLLRFEDIHSNAISRRLDESAGPLDLEATTFGRVVLCQERFVSYRIAGVALLAEEGAQRIHHLCHLHLLAIVHVEHFWVWLETRRTVSDIDRHPQR